MSTLTEAQRHRIASVIAPMHLVRGLGGDTNTYPIGAINLGLGYGVTDDIPPCMSLVIGRWLRMIHAVLPDALRNSPDWKHLLPYAAGTGRDHEAERLALILNWLWTVVLPHMQPLADQRGFGDAWRAMCHARSRAVAQAAQAAAGGGMAAEAAGGGMAAEAAFWTAEAAFWAAKADDATAFWETVNPPALLRQLIAVTDPAVLALPDGPLSLAAQ